MNDNSTVTVLEEPFGVDELFFSRTNEAGIILSGNSVFRRISGFGWDELRNKPHKVVRHPDMPRAVFRLLWETIKADRPIGAYVKNKTKEGRYYWVFAIVTPIEGGFLSVRIKPTSPLFDVVRNEYAALREWETRERAAPEESAARLIARLRDHGYRNYTAFMADAIAKEASSRYAQLGRPPCQEIQCFDSIIATAQSILDRATRIFEAHETNAYVSLNFHVRAAQLGTAGQAINEISSNFDRLSAEIKADMTTFVAAAERLFDTCCTGQFVCATALLQGDVEEFFASESDGDATQRATDMSLLRRQRNDYQHRADEGVQEVTRVVSQFRETCENMRRLTTGLQVTRVMGRVEAARLSDMNGDLNELIDELGSLQLAISDGLKDIDRLNFQLERDARRLEAGTRAA